MLNSVDIVKGCIVSTNKEKYYTQWVAIKDISDTNNINVKIRVFERFNFISIDILNLLATANIGNKRMAFEITSDIKLLPSVPSAAINFHL